MSDKIKIEDIEQEFVDDLANKYADVCRFKSDFPHHEQSVNDGFCEGFKQALNLVKYMQDESVQ